MDKPKEQEKLINAWKSLWSNWVHAFGGCLSHKHSHILPFAEQMASHIEAICGE
jgi:hypothetical protein